MGGKRQMTLNKIKKLKEERGFTIVELLIVIVVIGILAAIVIVAYNGVQNQARTTEALANAKEVVNKSEIYNADTGNGQYPATAAIIKAATGNSALSSKVNALIQATGSAPTSSNPTHIGYAPCPASGTPVTGAKISYWNYSTSAAVYLNAGSATGTTSACS